MILETQLCPLCPPGEGEVRQGSALLHMGLDFS